MRKSILMLFPLCMSLAAQTDSRQMIQVNAAGRAVVKPDLAIVFLQVRSSSPLANDALEQNRKKIAEVTAKLKSMGYKDEQIRFSGNRFSPVGGGVYYGGPQRPTGFDVYNNLYVTLAGVDLAGADEFNAKVGVLLDEASKAGAQTVNMPISSMSMGGASIVAFTIKDPAPSEKKAYDDAIEKARPVADEIARRMKVAITGMEIVSLSEQTRQQIYGGGPNPLDELPYEYLSSSINEVRVRVRLDIRFSYK